MSWLANLPIRRQLALVVGLTCALALVVVCAALATFEDLSSRRLLARDVGALANVLATNSQAALSFDDDAAAKGVLAALAAEPRVVAARIFNKSGAPFADYLRPGAPDHLPAQPAGDLQRFTPGRFLLEQPIIIDGKTIGSIYLETDLAEISDRIALFAGVSALTALATMLLAVALSARLQRSIVQPILALAQVATQVAERKDYTVRAPRSGANELGSLTDSFNHMLSQIHDQNRALRDSEDRVRAVLDCAISAVVVTDASGRIIDWSARAAAMIGLEREQALGRELAALVFPGRTTDALTGGFPVAALAMAAGQVLEVAARRHDGSDFPAELSVSKLVNEGAVSFCGFITDITERKRLAEELARRAERLRHQAAQLAKAHQLARLGNLELRFDGDLEQAAWSEELCRLLGVDPATVVPSRAAFLALINPLDRQRVAECLQSSISRREHAEFDFRAGSAGGGEKIFHAMLELEGDQGGQRTARLFANIQDITERTQAEEKVRAQLSRLDLLQRITRAIGERQDLASIFQVVIRSLEDHLAIDLSCICLYDAISKALIVDQIGCKSGELAMSLALPVRMSIPVEQNGLAQCVAGQLLYEPDISAIVSDLTQRLAEGGLRSLVAAPLLVEGKTFGALLVARRHVASFSSPECEFLRQLSEHVALAAHQTRLHLDLQRAYDDLRQSQQAVMQQERLRALGQMASGIAHDINNAISPIALYTQSLLEREPNLSPTARNYLETIERAIDDVASTVARMREFYRQRETQLALAPVQLNELVRQVTDLTRARWSDMPLQQGHVITMKCELAADLPPIMGSEPEIREALTNLIFNAVDAMPLGGTLTIRTRQEHGEAAAGTTSPLRYARLEVGDTGIGMDDDTRRRCLEPFFTTKGERGTGLGLAMVYGMVQRHSADIDIISVVGEGTTVRLSFLVSGAEIQSAPVEKAGPLGSRLRLLVVDDDPLLLKSLHDTLSADGHEVVTTTGGQAGIAAFQASCTGGTPFSLVITDLGMPYVDGRKVATAIKEARRATPVVLLTGWGQRLLAEGDIPPHVDRVLSKPPKLQDLRKALRDFQHGVAGARQ